MKAEIIKQLKKEKIDYWKVGQAEVERNNLYLEKKEEESYLSGKRVDYLVTVYRKSGQFMGESTVTIKEGDNISRKIKEAVIASGLVKNPVYVPFEQFQNYPKLKTGKALPGYEELRKQVREAYAQIDPKKAKINAFEVFTNKVKTTITTSIGQELSEEHNSAYAECVITTNGKRGEMEYLPMRQETSIGQIDLKKFVKNNYKIAEDIANSGHAKNFRGNLVLTGDALGEFFIQSPSEAPVIIHSSARMKFMNISRFNTGEDFEKNIKGDRITMKSNPFIEDGLRSASFDANLVPARELKIIENGVFRNFFASKKYADYMNIKPTGPFGNVEIGLGKTPMSKLFKNGNIEIVSFSWFSPNSYSGDFTAEIRLGYVIKDSKKIPFKGGMWVGNYFKVLADCILAREKWFKSGYYGPKAIMFRNSVISGSPA